MPLSDQQWQDILPSYLLATSKERIKNGLSQFFDGNKVNDDIDYSDFYIMSAKPYFLQGDLMHSIKTIEWDGDKSDYYSMNLTTMLFSNSCDIAEENVKIIKKEALFAPIIKLDDFFNELREIGRSEIQITSIYNSLRKQEYTNVFYLPNDPKKNNEYLVFMDKIFWHPTSELQKKILDIENERFLQINN